MSNVLLSGRAFLERPRWQDGLLYVTARRHARWFARESTTAATAARRHCPVRRV